MDNPVVPVLQPTSHEQEQVTHHNAQNRLHSLTEQKIEEWAASLRKREESCVENDWDLSAVVAGNNHPLQDVLAALKNSVEEELAVDVAEFTYQQLYFLDHIFKCQGALLAFLDPSPSPLPGFGEASPGLDLVAVTSYYIKNSQDALVLLRSRNHDRRSATYALSDGHRDSWLELIDHTVKQSETIQARLKKLYPISFSSTFSSDTLTCFKSIFVLTLQVVLDIISSRQKEPTLRTICDELRNCNEFDLQKGGTGYARGRIRYLRLGCPKVVFIGRFQCGDTTRFLATGSKMFTTHPTYPKSWGSEIHYEIVMATKEGLEIGRETLDVARRILGGNTAGSTSSKNNCNPPEREKHQGSDIKVSGKAFHMPQFKSCGYCLKCREKHCYDDEGIANEEQSWSEGKVGHGSFSAPLSCAEDVFAMKVKQLQRNQEYEPRHGNPHRHT